KARAHAVIDEWLLQYVPYDSYYFLMLEPGEKTDNIVSLRMEIEDAASELAIKAIPIKDADTVFDELDGQMHNAWLKRGELSRPESTRHDHIRISSREEPQVSAVFYRFFNEKENKAFSESEKRFFVTVTPHVLTLIRTSHTFDTQSKAHKYFDTYVKICSRIATAYKLSETEHKIMIELLFGKSNEEIGRRNFVAPATVKKHLRSIFKKTDTKGRIDFLGKFFTSPDRIDFT
ncbi:MAG: helix-turn-helix transcriptional regulator, partial [Bacteroidota bacterium]|nr:helix-turn-helix transcriptional regulator [Bacteroidota bacterium]